MFFKRVQDRIEAAAREWAARRARLRPRIARAPHHSYLYKCFIHFSGLYYLKSKNYMYSHVCFVGLCAGWSACMRLGITLTAVKR